MPIQCFKKPGSNPATCGVHNMPLHPTQTSEVNPSVRHYVCLQSGQRVEDGEWYVERGERLFCKQDDAQLVPQYAVTGTFQSPAFECPDCKRTTART